MNRALILLIALLTLAPGLAFATTEPSPPDQPLTGPGGSRALYETVLTERHGAAPTGYALFWPDLHGGGERLPVVIFLHGFSAVNPESYRGWIDHIVRRGSIVVFPDYQTANPIETPPRDYLPNVVTGAREAVGALERGDPVTADLGRVAIVGHSLGGVLTANLAAVAERQGLPVADAIMLVEPGGCLGCGGVSAFLRVPFADLSLIAPETLALVVTGDEDSVVGQDGARLTWNALTTIPLVSRDFIVMRSDRHGAPGLVADHYAPETGGPSGEIDALDWYGFWKWFDLLTDCAFEDLACDNALGGSAAQLDMGTWSDGTPVVQPLITDTP